MKGNPVSSCTVKHCISVIPAILKILISGGKTMKTKTKQNKSSIPGHQEQMMG